MCAWAVMLAVGCASTQVEHRNLSLHRRALAENGLAILAVTALGGGDYAAAEAVAAGFQKELARLRPAGRGLFPYTRSEEDTAEPPVPRHLVCRLLPVKKK